MKNKIIASKSYIILGIIGFLFALFDLCAMIDLTVTVFNQNHGAWEIIFTIFIGLFFIVFAILSLVLIYIGTYKYWIDDGGFLHKVNIFNVDKKIPLEDIVLIMKIQSRGFIGYLLLEKDFLKGNGNIIRKKSTIGCNGKSDLFIYDVMNKNSKIKYAVDMDFAWQNYCFVFRKINWLLKKAQRKNVELKISYHNYTNPVESFDFENIDFIQAEVNFDGKIIREKICIAENKRLNNGMYSKGYKITSSYKVIKNELKKIK